jgi:UDP-glucose 4-epimerase
VGDGKQRRDFIYVTDVARAFLAAAESSISGERFNVGAGKPQTINRLIELLGGEVSYIPKRPGEPDVTFADISKIRKTLGWEPTVSFEEGVKRMLDAIDHWQNAPLWDAHSIAKATQTWFKYLNK